MKKIAIIGSGISGLTCAHILDKQHDVTVFEKNDYVGGHTATVDIEHQGSAFSIDTGFIVFNDRTYPNFNQLLEQLGVERQPTEMSFSVHNTTTQFEYNGHSINSLFAQRSNIFKPQFWSLISDILKFNKLCVPLRKRHTHTVFLLRPSWCSHDWSANKHAIPWEKTASLRTTMIMHRVLSLAHTIAQAKTTSSHGNNKENNLQPSEF